MKILQMNYNEFGKYIFDNYLKNNKEFIEDTMIREYHEDDFYYSDYCKERLHKNSARDGCWYTISQLEYVNNVFIGDVCMDYRDSCESICYCRFISDNFKELESYFYNLFHSINNIQKDCDLQVMNLLNNALREIEDVDNESN